MTKGALVFAHNSKDVDYILLALVSAGLCKKHLSVPVSLVTDASTLDWAKQSNIYDTVVATFDKIIEVARPRTDNYRNLQDGVDSKTVPFVNTNRSSAWDLTPYDRTLLIDSDYLIFSNKLNEYWDVDQSFLIGRSMLDICDQPRVGYHDVFVSDTGPNLYWATTVMFTKNSESKLYFDTVNYIRDNYQYFADLYRFDPRQFRNDIAFSIAKHMLEGFLEDQLINLPPILTTQGHDVLHEVCDNGKLKFLINTDLLHNQILASITGVDVHIMNKQSIVRNKERLLALL